MAFSARRYLARHNIDPTGLAVAASFTIGGRPTRVTDVSVHLTPPAALPAERRDAFYAVAAGCTVHHTLDQRPAMAITFIDTDGDEDGGRSGPTTMAAGLGTANPETRDRSA